MENYHFQTLLPPLTGNSLPFLLFISEHFLPSFILWFMVHWSSPESRYTWKMVAVCIRERERESVYSFVFLRPDGYNFLSLMDLKVFQTNRN